MCKHVTLWMHSCSKWRIGMREWGMLSQHQLVIEQQTSIFVQMPIRKNLATLRIMKCILGVYIHMSWSTFAARSLIESVYFWMKSEASPEDKSHDLIVRQSCAQKLNGLIRHPGSSVRGLCYLQAIRRMQHPVEEKVIVSLRNCSFSQFTCSQDP